MSRTRLAWVGLLLAAQLTGCSGSGSIKEGLGKAMGKVFEPLVEAMTVGFLAQIHYSLKGRWPQSVEELRNLSQEVPELAQELGDLGLALQQISSSVRWDRFQDIAFVEQADGSCRVACFFSQEFLRSEGITLEGEPRVALTCPVPEVWGGNLLSPNCASSGTADRTEEE